MSYYITECEPHQVNRINGFVITETNNRYDYVGYHYITMKKELILDNWNWDLIDNLIHDNINERIVIIQNNIFEIVNVYNFISWYVVDGRLCICLTQEYPYYYLYYRYIKMFGMEIDGETCDTWFQLTKHLDIDETEQMKRIMLSLCV